MQRMLGQKKGMLYVVVSGILWGLSGVCGQYLFQDKGVTPEWLVSMRLLLPGILLLIWGYSMKGKDIFLVWMRGRDALKMVFFGIFGMLAVQLTFFVTISYSNAATATVLQYISPVLVALYISIELKRPPSKIMVFAITLALAGTFFLVTHGSFRSLSITTLALVWGILSAFASAIYTLSPGKLMQSHGTVTIAGWGMLVGGLALCVVYPPWQMHGVWDIASVAAIGYAVLIGGLVAFYIYLRGLNEIGGSKASILVCTEPLAAALFSVMFMGVRFTLMDWLGALCVIAAVLLLATRKQ